MKAPNPVPHGYLRRLIEGAGLTQGEAADMLRVDPSTMRRWLMPPTCPSHRQVPWAAAELLRRMTARKVRK